MAVSGFGGPTLRPQRGGGGVKTGLLTLCLYSHTRQAYPSTLTKIPPPETQPKSLNVVPTLNFESEAPGHLGHSDAHARV